MDHRGVSGMMQHYVKIKCDICGKEELIPYERDEVPYKERWKDFLVCDIYEMHLESRNPSTICPQCTERIERFIYTMTKESENGGPA